MCEHVGVCRCNLLDDDQCFVFLSCPTSVLKEMVERKNWLKNIKVQREMEEEG